jgi:chromosome segregation ATPase
MGLRQESSGLREESAAQGRKIGYLESRVDKSAQEIAELGLMREEIRKDREGVLEEQLRLKDERQKEIAELRRDRAAWQQELSKREEETRHLEERIKEATKLLASLDKLEKELRVRRDQLLHLQQVGEGRLKRQLEEWRKENEKRWAKSAAEWERQREEEAKRQARLVEIWRIQQEYARRQMAELERWIKELEEQIKGS